MDKSKIFDNVVLSFDSTFTKSELIETLHNQNWGGKDNYITSLINDRKRKGLIKSVGKGIYVKGDYDGDINLPDEVIKDDCIVLNKSFTGEWLNKDENNIAHEIINFFKADDNQIYIYNTPYGANVKNSKNLNIKYLYITTSKIDKVYYIEYCIEIEKSAHHVTIGKKEVKINGLKKVKDGIDGFKDTIGKSHRDIKYGGIPLPDLFHDTLNAMPLTYVAKKVWKAKKPIMVDEKSIESNLDDEADYNFARNFGYVLKEKNPSTYNHLFNLGPEKSKGKWQEENLKIFKPLDGRKKESKDILKSLDKDTFMDLIDNFKMEECYTKMLFKLMQCDSNFIKTFIKEADGDNKISLKKSEIFTPECEFAFENGRIDILATSEKHVLILENKIDSGFTMKKDKDTQGKISQLKRYYDWAITDESVKSKKKIYIILAPDYRLQVLKEEEKRLQKKEKFDKYLVVPYSVMLSAFNKHKNKGFLDFKFTKYMDEISMLLLRMTLYGEELYTAKITKHILSESKKQSA